MPKAPEKKPKKGIKSRRSQNTRRSSASTPTSRKKSRQNLHRRLATELYSGSFSPRSVKTVQEAVVEGVSMWPTLRPGYQIKFRAVHAEVLSPGDILVLHSMGRKGESQVRVHRLLGRVGPYFVEAGDNTYSAALVGAEDILGRVEQVKDWNGKTVKLPAVTEKIERRFRFLLGCAHAFMIAHECKKRVIGERRSLFLWRLSQAYRASLGVMGLKVPAIQPNQA